MNPQDDGASTAARRKTLLVCLSLGLLTFLAYVPLFSNSFVNFDDGLYVTGNRVVQAGLTREGISWAFTTTHAANWHPLTWLSHMLDVTLFGLSPAGHHLTSLLFHIANTLLLFLLFRKMTGALWKSALVAALFAVHPLHVESVAWVAERKDVLSAFFWILTTWAYLRFLERRRPGRYLWIVFFFLAGLLSKPMIVTLPFTLLLLDAWPLGRLGRLGRRATPLRLLVTEKAPLFLLSALSCVATFLAQRMGDAVVTLADLPLGYRIANALSSYASYLAKMIVPASLSVFYPYPAGYGSIPELVTAAGLLLFLSGGAVLLRKKFPWLPIGWLWFLGTLVPVIGLVKVGPHAMADRYTYIPLIGPFMIFAWRTGEIADRWGVRRVVSASAAGILLLALTAATARQAGYWHDGATLFGHAADVTKNNWVAQINLGEALAGQGRPGEAIPHYREAIRIEPGSAIAWNDMGQAFKELGNAETAIDHYREALRIDPEYAMALYNLAAACDGLGRHEEAIRHYREAIRIRPDYADAVNGLGVALAQSDRVAEAEASFRKALALDPHMEEAQRNLARILSMQRNDSGHQPAGGTLERIPPRGG